MNSKVAPSFHLTQVKHDSAQGIELVVLRKTILKIPAGKTVSSDITLDQKYLPATIQYGRLESKAFWVTE